MPKDAPASVLPSAVLSRARWLHNRRILRRVTGVDPLWWPDAELVEGWNYEWWTVDFGEPDGARLGAVDVLNRDDPQRCGWPHADAVSAIDSAWPTGPIAVRRQAGPRVWAPAAVRLPNPSRIGEHDDLSHDRYLFECAAASTKCATFLTDEPFADWHGELDAVGVGYDAHALTDMTVHITARPLHPEDCLGELDWEYVRGKWPDLKLIHEGDMMVGRVGRLGEMIDQWCPFPEGEPAIAELVARELDVLVEVPELDSGWLLHRLSLDPLGPSWWCRWCPEDERRPAQYVVGGFDGPVSCAAHLPNAARHEHALNDGLV
ncbi:hypothetical protein [Candidatus Poriferisodalis sp.]|uniref:hypothetical protein n=1 Tax=Candidatus Poriferisodalis sp. TaxID=3101277 RepID=UPI003B011F7F